MSFTDKPGRDARLARRSSAASRLRSALQAENRQQNLVVRSTGRGIARPPVHHSFPTRYRDAYRAELEC